MKKYGDLLRPSQRGLPMTMTSELYTHRPDLSVNSPKRRTPDAMAASMKVVLKSVTDMVGGALGTTDEACDF